MSDLSVCFDEFLGEVENMYTALQTENSSLKRSNEELSYNYMKVTKPSQISNVLNSTATSSGIFSSGRQRDGQMIHKM